MYCIFMRWHDAYWPFIFIFGWFFFLLSYSPIMFSYLGTNVIFNEIEFFTYINLWLLSLIILLLFFFILVYVTLYSVTSFRSTDSLLEIFVTFGSLVILFLIISPSLLLLFDTDITILPNTVISILGMQWAWESTIKISSSSSSSSNLGDGCNYYGGFNCRIISSSISNNSFFSSSHFSANNFGNSIVDDIDGSISSAARTIIDTRVPTYSGSRDLGDGCIMYWEGDSCWYVSDMGFFRLMSVPSSSGFHSFLIVSFNIDILGYINSSLNWVESKLISAYSSFFEIDWPLYLFAVTGVGLMSWAVSHPNTSLAHYEANSNFANPNFRSYLTFSNISNKESGSLLTNWTQLSIPINNSNNNNNCYACVPMDNTHQSSLNGGSINNYYHFSSDKIISYPLNTTSSYLIIPYHSIIKTVVSSRDVIHSYGVYSFGCKIDAIPGRFNLAFSIKPLIKGLFKGFCFELCGTNHTSMIINLLSL